MARYGLDYYSSSDFPLSYYGSDNPLNYDVTPITALSSGYGKITLRWVTSQGPWVTMKIVRNPFGYPVNISDGELVFECARRSDPTIYTDEPNHPFTKFFYYSFFVFDSIQLTWVLAGRYAGLNVKNYGTSEKLYNYLPQIYKITTPYVPSEPTDNEDLRKFLNLFGFYFDQIRAASELVKDRYNFENVTGVTIPLVLTQFGINYEPEVGFQQNRVLVRDSVQLSKEKGSSQGLREFIKSFTGWACPKPIDGTPNPTVNGLVISHNLMLDYNDSSFEEGVGHWVSPDNTATLSQAGSKKVNRYFVNNNILRLVIGRNGYAIGDKITISGFKEPKFNSSNPFTVIGTSSTQFTGYVEIAMTAPDSAETTAINIDTGNFPVITPYPAPFAEPTALALYPNKQKGILSVANATGTAQAITITCGSASPITLGIPVTSGDTYTYSVYSAAGSTSRSLTASISWYDRFGVFMATTTGNPVSNGSGSFSTRASVTAAAPCNIILNPFNLTAGSGYNNGSYTNVPLTYVSGKQFTTAPLANISILGGSVQSVAIVNGGKGSDTSTVFSFDKASIGSAGGSGFLATVNRVQESYYAAPSITISNVANAASGERHYFDAGQFEKAGSATSFDDARQVHLTMKATRINELKNPGFISANNFSPWAFDNATKTATTSLTNPTADVYNIVAYQQVGTVGSIFLSSVHPYTIGDTIVISGVSNPFNGLKTVTAIDDFTVDFTVTPSATVNYTSVTGKVAFNGEACVITKSAAGDASLNIGSNLMDVHYPNTFYNFNIYVIKGVGVSNPTVRARIHWIASNTTSISSTQGDVVTLTSTNTWSRVEVKSLAPENAAYARVELVWTNGSANDTIAVDSAIFENNPFALEYFDGSKGFTTTAELFWEGGTPGAGRSHYYKNRVAVQDRLIKGALDDWLISGSSYALYLAQPKT